MSSAFGTGRTGIGAGVRVTPGVGGTLGSTESVAKCPFRPAVIPAEVMRTAEMSPLDFWLKVGDDAWVDVDLVQFDWVRAGAELP